MDLRLRDFYHLTLTPSVRDISIYQGTHESLYWMNGPLLSFITFARTFMALVTPCSFSRDASDTPSAKGI